MTGGEFWIFCSLFSILVLTIAIIYQYGKKSLEIRAGDVVTAFLIIITGPVGIFCVVVTLLFYAVASNKLLYKQKGN